MGNQLTTFDFNSNIIRVVDMGSEPWFVAADVTQTLGFATASGVTQHLGRLDADELRMVRKSNLDQIAGSFPNRGANCISESGLYKLVMRSDKPEAVQVRSMIAPFSSAWPRKWKPRGAVAYQP